MAGAEDASPTVALGLRIGRAAACLALGSLLAAGVAWASGPRWVTGPPYFTGPSGQAVLWYTLQPLYFTDPGDLSASVDHAAADALVAAAAGVWNLPISAITLNQGGALNQHVSGANTYLGEDGVVFPPDAQSSNYFAKQIAVVYDSDGSVTDLLLGAGASSPAECRQNGVTESVDGISPAGTILHAVLVLNGRCTGPQPEQQLQLQYQLERAFGRVLGLGWSQTNDNVFTQTPQPTYNQAMHWPILHPMDIVCGPYTYQCLPQPFTLRDDDVAGLITLYPWVAMYQLPTPTPAPGKVWSYLQASVVYGTVSFPTGEGMQGVNVVVRRQQGGWPIPEAWQDVSGVSGSYFQQNGGNPVTGPAAGTAQSLGSPDGQWQGFYELGWIPDIDPPDGAHGPMIGVVSTEAINPLYIGAYAVGPYVAGQVAPSGAAQSQTTEYPLFPFVVPWNAWATDFTATDAASGCAVGDGPESAPNPVPPGGWWTDVLCAHGHAAWSTFTAQAGRTATLEVTALDEHGLATTAKAMPLIGVWAATDATGTLPTVAATPAAFNSMQPGMTALGVAAVQAQGLRLVIADARGDGRPDFAYRARVLYADTLQPAIVGTVGGEITIQGMGFRMGNTVTVNGVATAVTGWSATEIVAIAPPASAFRSPPTGPVDVVVTDLETHGTTAMTGALSYGNPPPGSTDPSQWRLVVMSGAGQAVALAGTFAPVVVMVTDAVGDPVAGAPVAVHQTADAAEMPCPTRGPCPIAPALAASDTAAISDGNGLVSVTPLQVAGVAEVTHVVVAAGTQGFVSLSLNQGP